MHLGEETRNMNIKVASTTLSVSGVQVNHMVFPKNSKLVSLGAHGYYLYNALRATSAHVIVPLV